MKYPLTYILTLFFAGMLHPVLAQQNPNILWITIEDTSPHFVGCYGNKVASTPNIDKLAANGTRFNAAFSTNTVCSPSRTTLITGVRTFENATGHHRSKVSLPSFMKGFPHYMRQAGYYTSNNVKTDYNITNSKKFTENAWDESSAQAGWWKRKPGQPFFAVFNYTESHQSKTMTAPYEEYRKTILEELPEKDRIKENAFEMPPFYRDSPEMRKQFARVYNSIKLTDNKIGALLAHLDKDKLTDSTIIFFFADHGEGIPRGKTNGINLGYRVPFVIWVPELYKHLSPWGKAGIVSDELVNFEDLPPTLISLAGGAIPAHMKGRILMGKNRSKPADHLILSSDRSDNGLDMVRSVTDGRYIYSRNYMSYMPQLRYINYMEIGEIKKQMRKDLADGQLNSLQKSLFEPRPAEYLYDTQKDVWETVNLADNAGYKTILDKMRKQLREALLSRRDVMFLPEYELTNIGKTTTPYEFRMSNSNYPLQEIYAAAELSGFRDEETASKQASLLENKNKIIRYWAAMGLRCQSPAVLQKHRAVLERAMKDAYLPVAISAAAIVYDVFGGDQAAEVLKQQVASGQDDLVLQAINYLIYVKDKKPFIPVVRQVMGNPEMDSNLKAACKDFLIH